MINVVAVFNVLEREAYTAEVEPGLSVAEILGTVYPTVEVAINGDPLPHEHWADTYPIDGDLVTAVNLPRGPAKAAIVAVAVAAVDSAMVAIGASSMAILAATAVTNVVMTVGLTALMMLPALIRPQNPTVGNSGGFTQSGRYSALNSGANQPARYEPMPKLYGNYRMIPPLACNYITESDEESQWLLFIVCLGYGPLNINGTVNDDGTVTGGYTVGKDPLTGTLHPKLVFKRPSYSNNILGPGDIAISPTALRSGHLTMGNTDLSEFSGVRWEIGHWSQLRQTRQPLLQKLLRDTYQDNLSRDFPRQGADKPTPFQGWLNDSPQESQQISTIPDTVEARFDLVISALYCVDGDGKEDQSGVRFRFRIKQDGQPFSAYQVVQFGNANYYEVTGKFHNPRHFNPRIVFPSAGKWDVEITRLSTFIAGNAAIVSNTTLVAMRNYKALSPDNEPWRITNYNGGDNAVLMMIAIKDTRQLNGQVDEVAVVGTSCLPVYQPGSGTWVTQATCNPAWIYADSLKGPQLQYPITDAQLDLSELADWADWCAREKVTYNWYHTTEETELERAAAICKTGFAGWHLNANGQFSVIREFKGPQAPYLDNFVPVQQFTPRNSRNFRMEKRFAKQPEALRVRYIDKNVWTDTEIVVYAFEKTEATARTWELLETQGVTDMALAKRHGKYFLNTMRLRPETYTLDVDFECLAVHRGSCVRIANDAMLIGLHNTRIVGLTFNVNGEATSAVVDEEITFTYSAPGAPTPVPYVARIRTPDAAGRDNVTLRLANVVNIASAGEPEKTSRTLTFSPPVTGINVGDLLTFGQSTKDTLLAKVAQIDYRADLSATLSLVPAAEALATDSADYASFDAVISVPPEMLNPQPPVITRIWGDGTTVAFSASGMPLTEVWVAWLLSTSSVRDYDLAGSYTNSGVPIARVELRYYVSDTTDPDNLLLLLAEQTVSVDGDVLATRIGNIPMPLETVDGNVQPMATRLYISARALSRYNRWSSWSAYKEYDVAQLYSQGASPAPTELSLAALYEVRPTGEVDYYIHATWAVAGIGNVDHYELEWKENLIASWFGVAVGKATLKYVIGGALPTKTYDVRVRTVNRAGVSAWVTQTITVEAKDAPPQPPSNFQIERAINGLTLTWDNPVDRDLSHIEIWMAPVNNHASATLIARPQGTTYFLAVTDQGTRWFWIRAVDTSGNFSAWVPNDLLNGLSGRVLIGDGLPPPAPLNFTVTPDTWQAELKWEQPTPAPWDLIGTEVWRSQTNDFATATRIGLYRSSPVLDLRLDTGETYYYWIRNADYEEMLSDLVPSPTTGVATTIPPDPQKYLELLEGAITESQLAQDLGAKIDVIPDLDLRVQDLEVPPITGLAQILAIDAQNQLNEAWAKFSEIDTTFEDLTAGQVTRNEFQQVVDKTDEHTQYITSLGFWRQDIDQDITGLKTGQVTRSEFQQVVDLTADHDTYLTGLTSWRQSVDVDVNNIKTTKLSKSEFEQSLISSPDYIGYKTSVSGEITRLEGDIQSVAAAGITQAVFDQRLSVASDYVNYKTSVNGSITSLNNNIQGLTDDVQDLANNSITRASFDQTLQVSPEYINYKTSVSGEIQRIDGDIADLANVGITQAAFDEKLVVAADYVNYKASVNGSISTLNTQVGNLNTNAVTKAAFDQTLLLSPEYVNYKTSVAGEIARIDQDIADVANIGITQAAFDQKLTVSSDYVNFKSSVNGSISTLNSQVGNLTTNAVTKAAFDQTLQLSPDYVNYKQSVTGDFLYLGNELQNRVTLNTFQTTADLAANTANTVSTLSQTVNGHTTSIQTTNNIVGGLSAQYTVKIDNNGYVTGYGLASTSVNGTPTSEFIVRADKFAVISPGNAAVAPAYPLMVITSPTTVNGTTVQPGVYINNVQVGSGALQNVQMLPKSITADHIDTRNLDIRDANGNIIFSSGQNLNVNRIQGLGIFATAGQLQANNIGTYIANGAVNNLLIGDEIKATATSPFDAGLPAWSLNKAGQLRIYGGLFELFNAAGQLVLSSGTPPLGDFAHIDKINDSNIGTYIAAGCIDNAYIGNVIQSNRTHTFPPGGSEWGHPSLPTWSIDKDGYFTIAGGEFVIFNRAGKVLLHAGQPKFEQFAWLDKMTETNIGVYMESAAITRAFIKDAAVSTLKIENNAVTVPESVWWYWGGAGSSLTEYRYLAVTPATWNTQYTYTDAMPVAITDIDTRRIIFVSFTINLTDGTPGELKVFVQHQHTNGNWYSSHGNAVPLYSAPWNGSSASFTFTESFSI
jgi:5,10-methylenetetrahydrofolate reductase